MLDNKHKNENLSNTQNECNGVEGETDDTNNPIRTRDHHDSELKVKQDTKIYWDWKKMLWMWPGIGGIRRKAKKIVKKNKKEAGFYSEEYCYRWLKKVGNRLIRVMNIDVKVEGIENWLDGGIILAPNHQSNFDPVMLLAINNFEQQQPVAFIAKQELWSDKKFAPFMNLIDCIPLDRQSPRNALAAFKEAKDLVVNYKRSLVIFPEGTRSGSNTIGEFHDASMKIAQMANVPVVPVTFINSWLVFSPQRKKRVEVKIIFGKPIMPKKHLSLPTAVLTKNVQRQVQENMDKWIDQEPSYELKVLRRKTKGKIRKTKKATKKKIKDLFKIID